jgi:hypothetical protein
MPPKFEARIVMFFKTKAALLPMWAIAGLQLLPGAAQAQTQAATPAASAATSTRPDPADPKARVPSALYVSPLRAYQAFSEAPVAPWRETNELVRQRGGWRAYAREAREPDAAASAAKPASGGHAGHETK